MNRIRELREAAGLSVKELAEQTDTSQQQIRRLESSLRRLTMDWMRRIAEALQCDPAELIANTISAATEDDVEPAQLDMRGLAHAIATKGLTVYRVTGKSVSEAAVHPGDIITVDESPDAVAAVKTGDIVVVRMAHHSLVLRLYVHPGLLVTHKRGSNSAIRTDDRSLHVSIKGVVIRD